MISAIREHLEDVAVSVVLKRVVPSLVAAGSTWIAAHLRMTVDGRPVFSPLAVKAILTLTVFGAHYAIHIWETLKLKAKLAQQSKEKEDK